MEKMETKVTEDRQREVVKHTCSNPKCYKKWGACMIFRKEGWFYTNGLGKSYCPKCGSAGEMV